MYTNTNINNAAPRFEVSDFDPMECVRIRHQDGSLLIFAGAFAFWFKDHGFEAVAVFSEHCGYHVFYLDDCDVSVTRGRSRQWKPLNDEYKSRTQRLVVDADERDRRARRGAYAIGGSFAHR